MLRLRTALQFPGDDCVQPGILFPDTVPKTTELGTIHVPTDHHLQLCVQLVTDANFYSFKLDGVDDIAGVDVGFQCVVIRDLRNEQDNTNTIWLRARLGCCGGNELRKFDLDVLGQCLDSLRIVGLTHESLNIRSKFGA